MRIITCFAVSFDLSDVLNVTCNLSTVSQQQLGDSLPEESQLNSVFKRYEPVLIMLDV